MKKHSTSFELQVGNESCDPNVAAKTHISILLIDWSPNTHALAIHTNWFHWIQRSDVFLICVFIGSSKKSSKSFELMRPKRCREDSNSNSFDRLVFPNTGTGLYIPNGFIGYNAVTSFHICIFIGSRKKSSKSFELQVGNESCDPNVAAMTLILDRLVSQHTRTGFTDPMISLDTMQWRLSISVFHWFKEEI